MVLFQVVQVYISWASTTEPMPQRQLVAFDRFFVGKGNSAEFKFVIKAEQMAVWTEAGWVVQTGKIDVAPDKTLFLPLPKSIDIFSSFFTKKCLVGRITSLQSPYSRETMKAVVERWHF